MSRGLLQRTAYRTELAMNAHSAAATKLLAKDAVQRIRVDTFPVWDRSRFSDSSKIAIRQTHFRIQLKCSPNINESISYSMFAIVELGIS